MRTALRLLVVLAFALGTVAVTASTPAVAQDGPDYVGENPPEGGTTVSGSGSGRSSEGGVLPITGADVTLLVALAVALIGLGWVLVRNVRGRRTEILRS